MKKNVIKKLAELSYSKNVLDSAKITKIANTLKRSDLKVYIKTLKDMESKNTVYITVPNEDGIREIREHFKKIYPEKKLVFTFDSSLLSGVRVVDYDNEYELSLKSFLESSLRSTND